MLNAYSPFKTLGFTALALASLASLLVACSSASPAATDGACGPTPVGSTCKTPGGACEALTCVGTSWKCPTGDTQVAVVPGACSSDDAGTCGPMPVGSTCKKPSGACEALVCSGSSWKCPAGDTEVAVVPGACTDLNDAGACGPMPVGSTCKKASGTCEPLACIDASWKCPAGDTQVPVVPGACGSESDAGACGPMPVGTTCKKPTGGCEALSCVGSTWKCPVGDTEVALTPGSCSLDGGT